MAEAAPAAMRAGWAGHLALDYRHEAGRTLAHDLHHGPLRVLQRLYPEGPGICHHVLVHPPGGIVGGDTLVLDVRLHPGSHALITTPGATRFYRSAGPAASQKVQLQLDEDTRLEWLPLENIAYSGCLAENRLQLQLQPGAEMLGWDLLALGLPASGQAFSRGSFTQHLGWPGVWLEQGRIDAGDTLLLKGALGLAGRPVLGTMWFAAGSALSAARREVLLEQARSLLPPGLPADGGLLAGATSPDPRLVLLRALAPNVEQALQLLVRVRAAWRLQAWGLAAEPPRIWRT